ncbi:MAG: hypothetical protein V4819_00765 [Verrucomicrobiota bacterium]
MRKKFSIATIMLLAGLGLWLGIQGKLPPDRDIAGRNHSGLHELAAAATSEGEHGFRTKASHRGAMPAAATHSPARLGEFILPPLVIEGLTLEEGLRKLLAAYQDACLKSGEASLPLTFSVPPEASRRLRVHLKSQSFRTSVRILATLAGMDANRSGLAYRFEPLTTGGKSGKETVGVSPDFQSILNEMGGAARNPSSDPFVDEPMPARKSIAECFAALGLEFDPATRVSLGASGELSFENASAADAAAIKTLAGLISSEPRVQIKFDTKIVELKAGTDWAPPDLSQMDDSQVQLLMRDFAQRAGTELQVMPSATAKNGQDTAIEITREIIYPTNDAGDVFEKRDVGHVLKIQGGQLGFGQDVSFNYTDTKLEGFDPANVKKPIFSKKEIASSRFYNDGGTGFTLLIHSDGSKTLVLMTAQQIDATGRPIH